ncbi:hypothetical protein Cni_G16477 [Canna indica]|uniref:Uncharacterized protein n=1 Tax=Canna indica TaxID=4628 RepID=A0AAQ3KHS8_9LILI|nr:hypothetical protein Cni_G16477 [Canna indica]
MSWLEVFLGEQRPVCQSSCMDQKGCMIGDRVGRAAGVSSTSILPTVDDFPPLMSPSAKALPPMKAVSSPREVEFYELSSHLASINCLLPKGEDLSRVLVDLLIREGLHVTSSNCEQVFETTSPLLGLFCSASLFRTNDVDYSLSFEAPREVDWKFVINLYEESM